MTIAENIELVYKTIEDACTHSGRKPSEVTLIAVSKTNPAEAVVEAIAAGVQHFGENRVEEAETKIRNVQAQSSVPISWHMIGHIQSRKAKEVGALFGWIHSVDTVKLAQKLSAIGVENNKRLEVLLEMNISGEMSKDGFSAYDWEHNEKVLSLLLTQVEQALALPGLNIRGLMTMAPIVENPEETRPIFSSMWRLREKLRERFVTPFPDLSMGMTDDYPIAIMEGATFVRVGRAIFGERTK